MEDRIRDAAQRIARLRQKGAVYPKGVERAASGLIEFIAKPERQSEDHFFQEVTKWLLLGEYGLEEDDEF